MATPMYVGAAGLGQPAPPPRENPGARRALMDAIASIDAARAEIVEALRHPVIDTCSVFIHRAGTQIGYARNNLLRANACIGTPAEVAPYLSYRRVPAANVVGGRRY